MRFLRSSIPVPPDAAEFELKVVWYRANYSSTVEVNNSSLKLIQILINKEDIGMRSLVYGEIGLILP